MPALADELTDRQESADRDVKWSAYAVGQILKNKLYLGHYSVAGVEEFVEEYQIVDEKLFKDVTNVRTRFQQAQKSDRPEMPIDRKEKNIQSITEQYCDFLNGRCRSDSTDA
jgi:site-specific DNA recombinase